MEDDWQYSNGGDLSIQHVSEDCIGPHRICTSVINSDWALKSISFNPFIA